jgi:hypothetical protein
LNEIRSDLKVYPNPNSTRTLKRLKKEPFGGDGAYLDHVPITVGQSRTAERQRESRHSRVRALDTGTGPLDDDALTLWGTRASARGPATVSPSSLPSSAGHGPALLPSLCRGIERGVGEERKRERKVECRGSCADAEAQRRASLHARAATAAIELKGRKRNCK